jgi:hypothetical protein
MYEKSHDEYMTAHSTTQSMYKIGHLTDVRGPILYILCVVLCAVMYSSCDFSYICVLCAVMYSSCDFSYICEKSYLVNTLCCTMCCHVLIMWFLVHLCTMCCHVPIMWFLVHLWDVLFCACSVLYYVLSCTHHVISRTSVRCLILDEYMTEHSTQMYEKSHDEYMTAHSTTQSMYKIGHLTDVREITWWVHDST